MVHSRLVCFVSTFFVCVALNASATAQPVDNPSAIRFPVQLPTGWLQDSNSNGTHYVNVSLSVHAHHVLSSKGCEKFFAGTASSEIKPSSSMGVPADWFAKASVFVDKDPNTGETLVEALLCRPGEAQDVVLLDIIGFDMDSVRAAIAPLALKVGEAYDLHYRNARTVAVGSLVKEQTFRLQNGRRLTLKAPKGATWKATSDPSGVDIFSLRVGDADFGILVGEFDEDVDCQKQFNKLKHGEQSTASGLPNSWGEVFLRRVDQGAIQESYCSSRRKPSGKSMLASAAYTFHWDAVSPQVLVSHVLSAMEASKTPKYVEPSATKLARVESRQLGTYIEWPSQRNAWTNVPDDTWDMWRTVEDETRTFTFSIQKSDGTCDALTRDPKLAPTIDEDFEALQPSNWIGWVGSMRGGENLMFCHRGVIVTVNREVAHSSKARQSGVTSDFKREIKSFLVGVDAAIQRGQTHAVAMTKSPPNSVQKAANTNKEASTNPSKIQRRHAVGHFFLWGDLIGTTARFDMYEGPGESIGLAWNVSIELGAVLGNDGGLVLDGSGAVGFAIPTSSIDIFLGGGFGAGLISSDLDAYALPFSANGGVVGALRFWLGRAASLWAEASAVYRLSAPNTVLKLQAGFSFAERNLPGLTIGATYRQFDDERDQKGLFFGGVF